MCAVTIFRVAPVVDEDNSCPSAVCCTLVLGPWSLVLGPWSLVLGPRSLVPGPRSLVLGP